MKKTLKTIYFKYSSADVHDFINYQDKYDNTDVIKILTDFAIFLESKKISSNIRSGLMEV